MAGYVVSTEMGTPVAVTGTYITQIRLVQAATLMKRSRTFEMEISAVGVPSATDCAVQASYSWCDVTGAGSGNATVVAQPLDTGLTIAAIDVAVTLARVNYATTEPTAYLAANTWWSRGFNQRSGVLWQSAPGREIIAPAVASIGPGLRAKSTNYTNTLVTKIMFDEV